jgi:SAM-dependent methyltransferase
VPDAVFAEPRLARLYDAFDGERADLAAYLRLVDELGAHRVLDLGCGTGSFAVLLAETGRVVVAVDPAEASLDVARHKPGADRVIWVRGDRASLPDVDVDLVTMTGNVAQVFLDDQEWSATLAAARRVLRPGGHLVFESRRPADRAWDAWAAREPVIQEIVGIGQVEQRTVVTRVEMPLVSFRQSYRFPDGAVLTSSSTLRFRSRGELESSLANVGFLVRDVRDAPDRPGREYVFICERR